MTVTTYIYVDNHYIFCIGFLVMAAMPLPTDAEIQKVVEELEREHIMVEQV